MNFSIDQTRTPLDEIGRPIPCCVVSLSVPKVDAYWLSDDPLDFIRPGGLGGKGRKYEDAMKWLKARSSIWMPTLWTWPHKPRHFRWSDGRHRFAAWRDQGNRVMPFCVRVDCREALLAHFS